MRSDCPVTRGVKEMCSDVAEHSKARVWVLKYFNGVYSNSQTAWTGTDRKKPRLFAEQQPDRRLSVLLAGTPSKYM